jgi:Ca-activated chloride channel family protein
MILISDGHDDASRHTFEEARNKLRDSDIVFYGIGFVVREELPSGLWKDKKHIFEEFADATGGAAFYPGDMQAVAAAFAQIADELHNQYRLGFRAGHEGRPNQWRRIKLTITPPANALKEYKGLTFKTRQGYYTK